MASDDVGELLEAYGTVLPRATDGSESFRFCASSVPDLPAALRTDAVVVTKGFRIVNGCWRAESLDVFADQTTLRGLGLIVLASLFMPTETSVEIELTHPATEVRRLRIYAPWSGPDLVLRPASYDYWPAKRSGHPWVEEHPDPSELPAFLLTTADETGGVSEDDWTHRDTVIGFGGAIATARLGSLLLDLGISDCGTDEVHLEGEAGFRGVGLLSAEVQLWLPGSFGWRTELGLDHAPRT